MKFIQQAIVCLLMALVAGCSLPPVPTVEPEGLPRGQQFVTLEDGRILFERHWPTAQDISAVVVLLHGSGSHSGALEHLAHYLTTRGLTVYGFDYPGFGYSPGQRAITPTFDVLQQVLYGYLELVRQRHPVLPIYLVGESMGGTLAIYSDINGGLDVAGVVLCGAAFDYPLAANAILRGVARLVGLFGDQIPLVPVEAEEFTRSAEAVARFRADPLMVSERIPVGHVNVLMSTIGAMRSHLSRVEVPFYVQHGSEDRVAPLAAAQELFHVAVSHEKKLSIYPDVLHAILHEPEWPTVAKDMADWMLAARQVENAEELPK